MKFFKLATIIFISLLSTSANSAKSELISRLGGLAYYDTVANLTWLTNANSPGESLTYVDATNWVTSLNIEGHSDWHLPTTPASDPSCDDQFGFSTGFNCTGSDMGNMFYNVLGGTAGSPLSTTHNTNYDLFNNLNYTYWSSWGSQSHAYSFSVFTGETYFESYLAPTYGTAPTAYVWAVHNGDVISHVPVPAASWLFVSGLLGLFGLLRYKKV